MLERRVSLLFLLFINIAFSEGVTYHVEEAQKEKMEDFLRREFGAKEVILTLREDKSLIGGFILSAGDKEFDWSLRGRYNNLRQKLTRR